MTARKPKPRKTAPRNGSKPTLEQRVDSLETVIDNVKENSDACVQWFLTALEELGKVQRRLDALETRKHFRDASHDEPVSNAGEAVGQHFTILSESLVKVPTKHGGWRWAWWRP